MKILKWAVLILVVVLIGAALVIYFNLNRIVKRTVETQATNSLNLQTQLVSANLALFGGDLTLKDLSIASPPSYSAPHMLTVGGTDVSVSYGQLRSDPVHVKAITINKPKLVIEQIGGKVNFQSAMDLMPKSAGDPNARPLKLIIDDLTIQGAQVVVRPGLPGLAQEVTLDVPTVNLKNIGTADGAQNGAALKDVVMQVVTVMASEASNSGKLPEQLKALLNQNLGETIGKLSSEAQQRLTKALPPEIGQAAQNAIGGLLGGRSATQPTTAPAIDAGKVVEQGLGDLLGGKKKK